MRLNTFDLFYCTRQGFVIFIFDRKKIGQEDKLTFLSCNIFARETVIIIIEFA